MSLSSDIYSVGKVASFCRVGRGTVNRWIGEGWIKAFSLPSGHLRVRREDLVEFLKQYQMPVPSELQDNEKKILILSGDAEVSELVRKVIKEFSMYQTNVRVIPDVMEACLSLGIWKPDLFILDSRLKNSAGAEVARVFAQITEFEKISVLIFSGYQEQNSGESFSGLGIPINKPWPFEQIKTKLLEALGI